MGALLVIMLMCFAWEKNILDYQKTVSNSLASKEDPAHGAIETNPWVNSTKCAQRTREIIVNFGSSIGLQWSRLWASRMDVLG